jgi:hypothetical protein
MGAILVELRLRQPCWSLPRLVVILPHERESWN